MVDLTLKVTGVAKDEDGKDAIIDSEHEHADGVLAFAKYDKVGHFGMNSVFCGGWSVRNFSAVLKQIKRTIGEDRFIRALELMMQMEEKEEEEHE